MSYQTGKFWQIINSRTIFLNKDIKAQLRQNGNYYCEVGKYPKQGNKYETSFYYQDYMNIFMNFHASTYTCTYTCMHTHHIHTFIYKHKLIQLPFSSSTPSVVDPYFLECHFPLALTLSLLRFMDYLYYVLYYIKVLVLWFIKDNIQSYGMVHIFCY